MRGEFYDDVNLNDLLTCHLKGSPRTRRQRKKRNPPFYVYRLWNVVTGKEYVGQCEAEEGIEKSVYTTYLQSVYNPYCLWGDLAGGSAGSEVL